MHNFKNVILVVLFNYSSHISNKDIINEIYGKHFKKIIFYSNFPKTMTDDEINYEYTNNGINGHIIFKPFYKKYAELINDSDGIFFTMDDNIINVNILHLFSNKKIIYYKNENKHVNNFYDCVLEPVNNCKGEWFDSYHSGKYGIVGINNLLDDVEFKKYNINTFASKFSNFFYLPKKYLNDKLFDLFEIFSKHEVFLEISIPSIIHNIEKDATEYQDFFDMVAYSEINNMTKERLYELLKQDHKLIIHPIKLFNNLDTTKCLRDIFCKDKCVIITTINSPTETILKHLNNTDYDVIIIGDKKTPHAEYRGLNCIYLDIDSQQHLFPELSELIPYNHYCRKNLGYLYAIKKGYKIIYETDDDNIPYDNFDSILQFDNVKMIEEQDNRWINIFRYFTNNAYIWPRGYPLSLLKTNPNYLIQPTEKTPSIINGLVENDPDVDALFRIICTHQHSIQWETNKTILISNKNMCVFNTQNTFWLNPELFISMIIPSSVSFRYCDILKGIICNIILNKTNNYMMYSSPNVIQNRNEHDLISDFKSEYEMYIHNEHILEYIENDTFSNDSVKTLLNTIYNNLLIKGVIKELDISILSAWFKYFD